MKEVVIASAVRLPIGRLGGILLGTDEVNMGATVINEVVKRAGIRKEDVDEIVFGHNFRTGLIASNSARVIALEAGFPIETPQFTINKHCAAGIKSVVLAAQAIKAGDADVMVAGGIDQMSKAVHFAMGVRWGAKLGDLKLQDQLIMKDFYCGLTTGETAEKLARTYNIDRKEQDEYALMSQQRAENAVKSGVFKDEIVPIEVKTKKNSTIIFDTDETPRFGTTIEALTKLKPAFAKDGTVTAGNACSMSDGAGAMVVMSKEKAVELGLKPMAKIVGYASVGVDPSIMGIGPVPATRKVLDKLGLTIEDMDVIELNEAFACQSIYFIREMKPDLSKLNVNGGAIALGHPIAATGSVILTKLLYELQRRNGKYGLATMCIGGGLGMAIVIDREI